MSIDLFMPVRLISGYNCVKCGGEIIKNYGKSCLVVTGGHSAELSGALVHVTEVLEEYDISYSVFSEVSQNPLISVCRKGGEAARSAKAEFIIGIGGGSALDAAKAIAIYAANPEFEAGDIYNRTIPAAALPVLLIGTTAGTGSEVTGVSVLTDDSVGLKKSISGADCYAAVSFLNPRYTDSMPLSITVSTALDALAHAVEGWFSPKCSELARAYASLALPKLFTALFEMYRYDKLPGKRGRDELYYASIYAGLSLNITGAAFPHTMGYVLTEDFGIPHGRACTAFMPYLIKRANLFCRDRLWDLYCIMGTDEEEFLEMVSVLTDVKIDITEFEIKKYCERWNSHTKNFLNSPGGFNEGDAYLAFRELIG